MKQTSSEPSRGDIWLANLNPTIGHEQAGKRPCLIISVNPLNHGPADITIIIPITSVKRYIPTHIEVIPPEGGLLNRSYIKCEDVRSVSKLQMIKKLGSVNKKTISEVEDKLRILIGL